MGLTPLMWKSLQNCIQVSNYIYSCPIVWDSKNKVLRYNNKATKFRTWLSLCFIIAVILLPSSAILVFALYGKISVPPSKLIYTSIIISFSVVSLLMQLVAQQHMRDYMLGFSSSIKLEAYLRRRTRFGKQELLFFNHIAQPIQKIFCLSVPKNSSYLTLVGIILNISVGLYAIFPYFLCSFGIYFQLDPLYLLGEYGIIPKFPWYFRIIVLLPAVHICCALCVMFCLLTVTGHISLSSLTSLEHLSPKLGYNRKSAETFLNWYSILRLNFVVCANISNWCCLLFMVVGLVAGVWVNFVTIKMYRVTSMPIYLFFPVCSLLMAVMANLMISITVNIYNRSGKVLIRLKRCISRNSRTDSAYIRRKVRAIKAIQVYAGTSQYIFFGVKALTKLQFYYTVINFTITALLSIPGDF